MRHTLSNLAFSGLVALGLVAVASSAGAAAHSVGGTTVNAVKTIDTASEGTVVKVGDHRWRDRDRDRDWRDGDRHWRDRDRRWRDRHHWRRYDRPRAGIYFEFGTGGYRPPYYAPPPYYVRPPIYARPRYVPPRPAYRLSTAHVNWCYARYRSYRAWDNTFQPYYGPRRACISPYMG